MNVLAMFYDGGSMRETLLFDNLHNHIHVTENNSLMSHANLSGLAAFHTIATHCSFRKAALEMGVSASALSHNMRTLEEQLGVRLLHRTTRSVSLTEAGRALLEQLQPALVNIQVALDGINDFRISPRGTLRLTVPPDAGRFLLAPKLSGFFTRYPDINVELISDDSLQDIVSGRFDAGIRCVETLPQDMIAIPLGGQQQFVVVASPTYYAAHGTPVSPQDLGTHECICWRFPNGEMYRWEFEYDEQPFAVGVQGRLTANDPNLMREAARQGLGLAYLLRQHVEEDLQRGTLVQVLEKYCPAGSGFFLYHPSRKQMSASLRAFIDYWKAC
ncbi:LysR family transcriptional regulator [Thiothrix lacustris]|nr:LysR family transcriptional regulator [Thiothrix lacustris]